MGKIDWAYGRKESQCDMQSNGYGNNERHYLNISRGYLNKRIACCGQTIDLGKKDND
jgi:hypothetical protein